MITAHQTKLIHVAARQVGLNDAQYRTLLASAGGVDSSRKLDQARFEDVMAVLEDLGFADRAQAGSCYWRNKVRDRGARAGERMIFKVAQLTLGCEYDLEGLCRRFSEGRTSDLRQLRPREAWKLIEAMKAINNRKAPNGAAGEPGRSAADRSGKEPGPQGGGAGQGCPSLFDAR